MVAWFGLLGWLGFCVRQNSNIGSYNEQGSGLREALLAVNHKTFEIDETFEPSFNKPVRNAQWPITTTADFAYSKLRSRLTLFTANFAHR